MTLRNRISSWERRAAKLARLFYADRTAATAIEYGLIAVIVSISIFTGAQAIGSQLVATFTVLHVILQEN